MSPFVLALVLVSAVCHATWNAALRSGADRLWAITIMTATTAVVAVPFVIALPAPATASLRYLASSAVLQVAYSCFLVRAYRTGHLAQVYPIARGSSPLLVTVGAAVFAHETLSTMSLVGVVVASAGIVALAAGKGRPDRASLSAALATGVFIAAYTVVDGIGSRLSGHPISYVCWMFIAQGTVMAIVYRAVRGAKKVGRFDDAARASPDLAKNIAKAVGGGVLSIGSYGTVVWALSLSPMGMTSALRETSVLFAALIGRVWLREPLGGTRLAACLAIVAGALLLAWGGA